jgi:hypothetical protein
MYEGDSIKRKFLDKIISNYNLDYKKNLSNLCAISDSGDAVDGLAIAKAGRSE